MANNYFVHDTALVPGTKARAADVNNRFNAVEDGFDKLPVPTAGGFLDPVVVGEASSEDHAVTAGQVRDGKLNYTVDTGTANTMVAALPQPPPAYTAGMTITVKVAETNTGATVLDLNGLGARPVMRISGEQLYAGDLVAGRVVGLRYDGASFVLLDGTYAVHNHDDLYTRSNVVDAHTGNTSNPHAVTKAQVGLGNVANVDTTNASNITSGTLADERIASTIARDSELAAHTGRTDNPHAVTKAQVGLGNVANVDTTNASNITSGTLADERIASTIARDSELAAHTGRTDNPHVVTKTQVGLGNVDNTSDANKPVSTATQTALNLKANLASPVFTGNPTAPTQAYELGAADKSTKIATTQFVHKRINELTKGAHNTAANKGYLRFPNATIIQWGLSAGSPTPGAEVTIMFPSQFANAFPTVLACGSMGNVQFYGFTNMSFKATSTVGSDYIAWIAFGVWGETVDP